MSSVLPQKKKRKKREKKKGERQPTPVPTPSLIICPPFRIRQPKSPANKLPSISGRFRDSDPGVLICGAALSTSPAACFRCFSPSCSGGRRGGKRRQKSRSRDRRGREERESRKSAVAAVRRGRELLKRGTEREGGGMNIPILPRSLASSSGGQGPLVFVSSPIICMMYSAASCSAMGERKAAFWQRG